MKIIRTNASAGGTTKSCYQLWQEGFNTNWDSVVTNANLTYDYRILHVYVASERLHLNSFSTHPSKQIAIYNANTQTYRYTNVQVDPISGNNYILFEPSDYFINNQDSLSYVCVVYSSGTWGNWVFRGQLPVVYANNKFSDLYPYTSLLGDAPLNNYPLLRGVDLNVLSWYDIYIYNSIEHIGYQRTTLGDGSLVTYIIRLIQGNDTQLDLFNTIYDDLILRGNTINPIDFTNINLNLCDTNKADDFFNKFLYNVSGVDYYNFPTGSQVNFVEKFKIKQTPLKSSSAYRNYMSIPSCVHIDGLIEESTDVHDGQGFHGFNSSSYTNLMDFPMWKVLEGATTGCLRPITDGVVNSRGDFRFVSGLLDPKKFCEFDENGIIEDPTKYFICNLPVVNVYTPITNNQKLTFNAGAANFKNWFTPEQRDEILTYVNAKNWILTW